jgi:hypothetical protein
MKSLAVKRMFDAGQEPGAPEYIVSLDRFL